jgi:predicted cupin superfamily sugar epimerase
MNAEEVVKLLDLKPHPEGGFYRETYRSPDKVGGLHRAVSTGIYYLLVEGSLSKFHSLKSDEMFHFYLGDPVTWVLLHPDGKVEKVVLGNQLDRGHVLQLVIPAGVWFAGSLGDGGKWGLMGTTVAPGFEFEDLVFGKREELLRSFPAAKADIERLT